MGDISILILSIGGLFLLICAGLSLVIKALSFRSKSQTVKPKQVMTTRPAEKVLLSDRLEDFRSSSFAVPSTQIELRAPPTYKGPFRRTATIRRTAKQRRYHDRRQLPKSESSE